MVLHASCKKIKLSVHVHTHVCVHTRVTAQYHHQLVKLESLR